MPSKTVFDIKIDLDNSHGSYVYDKKTGQKFLDFFDVSSLPLGYNHKIFDENYYGEVKIAHIKMCNNLFETDEMLEFDNIFSTISPLPYRHYCSTGTCS